MIHLVVFVDSSGNIFIGDSQNYRVVKWEPGASEGSIVAEVMVKEML